jgi:hypothetical protein
VQRAMRSPLFLFLIVEIASQCQVIARAASSDHLVFSGTWVNRTGTFSLTLYQRGNMLTGYHFATNRRGTRIDTVVKGEDQPSVSGRVRKAEAIVRFESAYGENAGGTARIAVNRNCLTWRILKDRGVHFFPARASLRRKQRRKVTVKKGSVARAVLQVSSVVWPRGTAAFALRNL